jgi:limonene 1,2-monooxygenase
VIDTPGEMVKTIRTLQEVTGGFGVAHNWANPETTLRSWDLFARYVIPEINGYTRNLKASAEYLAANKVEPMNGLNAAIMATVQARGEILAVPVTNPAPTRPVRSAARSRPRAA